MTKNSLNISKIVIRTEQIWIKPDKDISNICHLSKNLWNQANYIIKNAEKGNWIRYEELNKILKEESDNYKSLPVQTSQQILKIIDKAWSSFFRAIKVWKNNPDKSQRKPKPPKYKKKNGEHILVFTNQQCKIKRGILKFPKKVGLEIKTRLPDETNLREVRIIPKGVGYICEVVYNKEVDIKETDSSRIIGIDIGVRNLITIVNNIGLKPIVVKGGVAKSINQYYNKRKAELSSVYDMQGIKYGNKMDKLSTKRERKLNDFFHKVSRFVVNWCKEHNIGTIVIGHNDNWKQKVNIGRINNQNFVQIPFDKLIQKIDYKAEEVGITLKEQEESHTSVCSFLDNEPIEHHKEYLGKRIKRGIFRTAKGILINADVNAGYNIIKKAVSNAFAKAKADGIEGVALHPLCYSITNKGNINKSNSIVY